MKVFHFSTEKKKNSWQIEEDYFHTQDIIIRKPKHLINYFGNVHQSIWYNIQKHLNSRDLSALKASCSQGRAYILPCDVVEKLIQEIGMVAAFCKYLHIGNTQSTLIITKKYGLPDLHIWKGIIYCIGTFKNTLAKELLTVLGPKLIHWNCTQIYHETDHCVSCQTWSCLWTLMADSYLMYYSAIPNRCGNHKNVAFAIPPNSSRIILHTACAHNNIEMVKYLVTKYNLSIGFNDLWISIVYCAPAVFKYLMKINPTLRISENVLCKIINFQDTDTTYKWEFIYTVFEQGLVPRIGRRFTNTIINYIRICNELPVLKQIHEIINIAGSKRLVQSCFGACLFECLSHSTNLMIETSKITYKAKHLRIVENSSTWRFRNPKMEYIIVNKLKLQEIRAIQENHHQKTR